MSSKFSKSPKTQKPPKVCHSVPPYGYFAPTIWTYPLHVTISLHDAHTGPSKGFAFQFPLAPDPPNHRFDGAAEYDTNLMQATWAYIASNKLWDFAVTYNSHGHYYASHTWHRLPGTLFAPQPILRLRWTDTYYPYTRWTANLAS